jgi:hypothetical protein
MFSVVQTAALSSGFRDCSQIKLLLHWFLSPFFAVGVYLCAQETTNRGIDKATAVGSYCVFS